VQRAKDCMCDTVGAIIYGAELPWSKMIIAQARRTSAPGWTQAEPQILILPDPVREALVSWAVRAAPDSAEEPTDPAMGDGFAVGVRMVLTPRHQKGAAGRPQRLPAQADVTSRRRGRNPVS